MSKQMWKKNTSWSLGRSLFITAVGLLLTSGCANYASFQEADVVEKGDTKVGGGITYSRYEVEVGDVVDQVTIPALNLWGRYGVTEKLEVHGSVWLPLGASVGAKYQLLGDRKSSGFALSIGGDLGYLEVSTGSGENENSVHIVDLYLPIYTGYRFADWAALYLTPKYILRGYFGDDSSGFSHTPAVTLGTALGSSVQFLVEGTAGYDINIGVPVYTAGVGIAF